MMDDIISKLSEIRSGFNCFDEGEESQYRALSEAIEILSKRADGDTISRQAAIGVLEERLQANGYSNVALVSELNRSIGYLMKLPSAQRWIPVTERLPEEKEKCYWVCTDTGYQCECRWTNNVYGIRDGDEWNWKIFDIPQYSHVVAWMPLPEPYKPPKEDKL